jgi:hypothetical protein
MNEGKAVNRRCLRRRGVKAFGEAEAPGPKNTSEDGGKSREGGGWDTEITCSSSEQIC